jgi:FAD/FMN-containing dehydrogenase
MSASQIRSLDGRTLEEEAIQAFISGVRGTVLRPGDEGYDAAREVQNGLIDRRPGIIVRCSGAADVIDAVNFARDHHLLLSVRGGGHNVAGTAVCDDGLMIDLSLMTGVRVDPKARTVRAEGGATWADVDRETQVFGLATPGGVVSTTGIGGLTLHGGMGHLRRAYGLSIDNLLSVDIVTADGQLRTASATENSDLFWAVRGAGSNFGVVTSFEFRLHPVGPVVALAAVMYALEDGPTVIPKWRDFMATAPEEITGMLIFWSVPAAPDFPEDLWGKPIFLIGSVFSGPADEGERALMPLRNLGTPVLDLSGQLPYAILQGLFDWAFPKGRLCYWKSLYVDSLPNDLINQLCQLAADRPSPLSPIDIWHHGGAMASVPASATAFGRRDAPFMLSFDTSWDDPDQTERNIAWTRAAWAAMHRYSSGGLYINFPGFGEEKEDLVRAAYGDNYERLATLKAAYDPTNLFRMNQNITPAVDARSALPGI